MYKYIWYYYNLRALSHDEPTVSCCWQPKIPIRFAPLLFERLATEHIQNKLSTRRWRLVWTASNSNNFSHFHAVAVVFYRNRQPKKKRFTATVPSARSNMFGRSLRRIGQMILMANMRRSLLLAAKFCTAHRCGRGGDKERERWVALRSFMKNRNSRTTLTMSFCWRGEIQIRCWA